MDKVWGNVVFQSAERSRKESASIHVAIFQKDIVGWLRP